MAQAFDYTARDYTTIKNDLLARAARVFPEWTDRDSSDFGMLMVDLWAQMGDVMHYYIDRAAGEAFLGTATQRESVIALANLLDYVPRSRSSATGTVTLQNQSAVNVTISAYTTFVARSDNTTYSLYTPSATVIPALGTAPVILTEGVLYLNETLTTSANGSPGQSYVLSNKGANVSSLSVQVYEDGVTPTTYQRYTSFTSAIPGDRAYTSAVTADGYLNVTFGTASNGFVPPTGSKIVVTYATSSGSSGNLAANSVSGFKAAAPAGISIASSTALSGGVDDESITSMRSSIPSVISSQNRAVTQADFVALTNQISGVAKSTMVFATGDLTHNASVTVYPQGPVSDYLTNVATSYSVPATLQTDVMNFLQPRALLGVTVLCAPTITWQPVKATITVHVADRYVSNWVKAAVSTAIDELFDFDNVFFGQRLTLGQLYRIVLNVPGVDYCTVSVFDLESGAALQDSILIDPLKLPKKGTITLTMAGGITSA